MSDVKAPFDSKAIIAETKVIISKNGTRLSVIAETPRLIIRPVEPTDVPFYQHALWGSPTVTANFAEGKVRLYKDAESELKGEVNYAQNRIVDAKNSWCERWENNSPWSGMTIIDKRINKPIGHVVIGGGELAYLSVPEVWGKRIASEAVTAMTGAILPALVLAGYTTGLPKNIEATSRPDYPAALIVLERAGLSTNKQVINRSFNGISCERYLFTASVAKLVHHYRLIKEAQHTAETSDDIVSSPSYLPSNNRNIPSVDSDYDAKTELQENPDSTNSNTLNPSLKSI